WPEAFDPPDGGRKPRPPGRAKAGDAPQAQARPRPPPQRVGVDLGTLEDRVIIELGVPRQSHRPPVVDHRFHDEFRGDYRVGPGHDKSPVGRDAVADFDLDTAQDDTALT